MLSPKVRRAVWERDQGFCGICRLPVAFGRFMEIDHVVPLDRDGCNHPENLRATHKTCNRTRDYADSGTRHCSEVPPSRKLMVYVDQEDRANMETIRRAYKLASDSAAIRFALQQAANEAKASAR